MQHFTGSLFSGARLLLWWLFVCASSSLSAAYPDKPVRLVVPFPAGGSVDTVTRVLAEQLGADLKQQFIVENRPGAGGGIGSSWVAKARADGYTVLVGTISSHAINRSLYSKLPYDPQRDFAPVSQITSMPNVLVVPSSSPARSLKQLVDLAKSKPAELTFASGGNGTTHHLCGEMFARAVEAKLTHVPYKGNAPAVTDLLGGQVAMMFDNISNSLPHVRSGRLHALAVTGPKRSSALPEVPTMLEAGFPGFDVTSWFALFAPAGTPPAVIRRLHLEVAKALREPRVREVLAREGIEPVGSSPDELAALVRNELARWAKIVAASGARID